MQSKVRPMAKHLSPRKLIALFSSFHNYNFTFIAVICLRLRTVDKPLVRNKKAVLRNITPCHIRFIAILNPVQIIPRRLYEALFHPSLTVWTFHILSPLIRHDYIYYNIKNLLPQRIYKFLACKKCRAKKEQPLNKSVKED